jgi:hypothetical protein
MKLATIFTLLLLAIHSNMSVYANKKEAVLTEIKVSICCWGGGKCLKRMQKNNSFRVETYPLHS